LRVELGPADISIVTSTLAVSAMSVTSALETVLAWLLFSAPVSTSSVPFPTDHVWLPSLSVSPWMLPDSVEKSEYAMSHRLNGAVVVVLVDVVDDDVDPVFVVVDVVVLVVVDVEVVVVVDVVVVEVDVLVVVVDVLVDVVVLVVVDVVVVDVEVVVVVDVVLVDVVVVVLVVVVVVLVDVVVLVVVVVEVVVDPVLSASWYRSMWK